MCWLQLYQVECAVELVAKRAMCDPVCRHRVGAFYIEHQGATPTVMTRRASF